MATVFANLNIALDNHEKRFRSPSGSDFGMGDMMDFVTANGGRTCNVNKTCTHLVGASWVSSRQNFKSAVKYKIPVVTEDWLFACVNSGHVVATEPFALKPGDGEYHKETKAAPTKKRQTQRSTKSDMEVPQVSNKKQKTASDSKSTIEKPSASSFSIALASMVSAKHEPVVSCKGSPTFPSCYLASLFDEVMGDIRDQRNSTLMRPLCAYLIDILREEKISIPIQKKKTLSTIGVGRAKIDVPALTDELMQSGDLITVELRAVIVANMKHLVAAYHDV
jgi:hypothetical protein